MIYGFAEKTRVFVEVFTLLLLTTTACSDLSEQRNPRSDRNNTRPQQEFATDAPKPAQPTRVETAAVSQQPSSAGGNTPVESGEPPTLDSIISSHEDPEGPALREYPTLTTPPTNVDLSPVENDVPADEWRDVVKFSPAPSEYQRLIQGALHDGTARETKGLSLLGEQWNIERAELSSSDDLLTVTGKISHHIPIWEGLRDHRVQFRFTFKKNGFIDAHLSEFSHGRALDKATVALFLADTNISDDLTYANLPPIFDHMTATVTMPRWQDGAQLLGLYVALTAYRQWLENSFDMPPDAQ